MVMFFESSHHAPRVSLKAASLLAGVPEKAVRHALADRVARPRRVARRPRRRFFRPREVLFFDVVSALPFDLSVPDRRDLYQLLARRLGTKGAWRREGTHLVLTGRIEVRLDTAPLRARLARRLLALWRGSRRVESRPDVVAGEPVFRGTRIPVRHVGLLARRGMMPDELLREFPALCPDDVEFAAFLAALGPPPGRPRKHLALRRGERERPPG